MRARDLEDAMDWLKRADLIYQTHRINEPSLYIEAYQNGAFKLYFVDVGLLSTKADIPASVLIEKNTIFKEFKGALTEQYTQQQLRSECGIDPHYWQNDTTRTEIDFIFQTEMNVVPVEEKAETNTKAKSLLSYCHKHHPKIAVRCSMNDFNSQIVQFEDGHSVNLIDLPLYTVFLMRSICQEILQS